MALREPVDAPAVAHPDAATSLPVLRWPALDATGAVEAAVTTRVGGVSTGAYASLNLALHVGDEPDAVVENRRRATAHVGTSLDLLIVADQVHGRHVAVVGSGDVGRGARDATDAIPATDALVTCAPDVTLMILVADCVPLVLVDPVAGVLGCVHAGWRGTVAGITAAALDTMVGLGADPAGVIVGIGPAVDPATYEVGADVAEALRAEFGDLVTDGPAGDVLVPATGDTWRCDLVAANTLALLNGGIAPRHIHALHVTTADERLFSHRRGDAGRFAAIARLTTHDRPSGTSSA